MTNLTRRCTLIGLSALIGLPARAQNSETDGQTGSVLDPAALEKPAMFEIVSISGSLKETKQTGQEMIWRRMGKPADRTFRLSNLAVGLLAVRGMVTLTFSCNISSHGYLTLEEAQVHVILRTKGGAALYTSVVGLQVQCGDDERALHPATDEIPPHIAGLVFANVSTAEITEHTESSKRGVKVRRCR